VCVESIVTQAMVRLKPTPKSDLVRTMRVVESIARQKSVGNPLVSVVIPSYNHAQFLSEAINSVLGQSETNLELIIIDDGSSDNSVEIIEKLISKYPERNITCIARDNLGLCRTLNEGLRLVKGKYFAYLGSDDRWHPDRLKLQLAVLEDSGADVAACYCDCDIIDSEGNFLNRAGAMFKYRAGDIYSEILWGRFMPMSPTGIFRTEVVRVVGGFDESHAVEDKDLWLRIAREHLIAYVDEPLASWRVHGSNTSKSLEVMQKYGVEVLNKALKEDPLLQKLKNKLFARVDSIKAAEYYELLDMRSARKFAVRALSRKPFDLLALRTYAFSLLGSSVVARIRKFRRRRSSPNSGNASKS
jgi:alpha-1,3-rhamnosyltransferase